MNFHLKFCRKQKKNVYTRDDCTEPDLIQYSIDHFETAEKLYKLSGRDTWKYLHSAAFLLHLSIELLLKACVLHYEHEFPKTHDLKRLFQQLSKKRIDLSDQNKKWLNYLNKFNWLRYPDSSKRTEVDINDFGKTKALFYELWNKAPKEIKILLIEHTRYRLNVKSGKTIYPAKWPPNGEWY